MRCFELGRSYDGLCGLCKELVNRDFVVITLGDFESQGTLDNVKISDSNGLIRDSYY